MRGLSQIARLLRISGTAILLASSSIGYAQDAENVDETARRYDAVSPTGVSYSAGSFTYNLPLLSIGEGGSSRKLTYGLRYNSGSTKNPNTGWVFDLAFRISRTLVDDPAALAGMPDGKPHPEWRTYLYNVVAAHRSEGFENFAEDPSLNPYAPVNATGSTLEYTSVIHTPSLLTGYFTYTGAAGEVVKFKEANAVTPGGDVDYLIEPDGTRLSFGSGAYSTISNNVGVGIFFEPSVAMSGNHYSQKFCAINLTEHVLASLTACPSGAQSTTIVINTNGNTEVLPEVVSVTDAAGGIYQFLYAESVRGGVTRRAVSCIKEPGSSVCSVQNTYDTCDNRMGETLNDWDNDPRWSGSRDRVVRQDFPTGEYITYTWADQSSGCRKNGGVTTTDALNVSTTFATFSGTGTVVGVTDPLSRTSQFTYTDGGVFVANTEGQTLIRTITDPEGNITQFSYDVRGNLIETRKKAKPGTQMADIVTSADFPSGTPSECPNRKTCNKPTSRTDANGHTTTYTYDPAHGGVLTETGPAVNGVQPQKRFEYVQRYAWLKNSSGGYSQASSPVWLLAKERFCRTTAASGAGCAGGAADEVVTSYDYGPNSGPNNLWVRGTTVTADGQTLRTCFGHDSYGRKISETKPAAGLTACP